MQPDKVLTVFISRKMEELAEERRAVQIALSQFHMIGWLWETDAGARPESIRSTYLKEVEACDIYIGLFWLRYGEHTINEFEYARSQRKPCLIYEKTVFTNQRQAKLQTFLDHIQRATKPDSLTTHRFETLGQIAQQVQKDIVRLLSVYFQEFNHSPLFVPHSQRAKEVSHYPQIKVEAKNKGIAINNLYGNVEQHNCSHIEQE